MLFVMKVGTICGRFVRTHAIEATSAAELAMGMIAAVLDQQRISGGVDWYFGLEAWLDGEGRPEYQVHLHFPSKDSPGEQTVADFDRLSDWLDEHSSEWFTTAEKRYQQLEWYVRNGR